MEQETKEKLEAYPLRLPTELKSAVAEIARQEKRSMNTQIVFVLENFVKKTQEQQPQTVAA
jgi:hypothetical protein